MKMETMTETSGIYGELRKRVEAGMTAEKAADSLLRAVSKVVLAEFVRPLLVKEAMRYVRGDARDAEQGVFAALASGGDPVQVRKDLLDLEFWVDPATRYVTYRESTPDHHDRRADFQEKHAKASLEDAKFHRDIARDMRAAGARTFEQLTVPLRSKHLRRAKAFAEEEVKA